MNELITNNLSKTHGIAILNDATIAEMVEGFIVNEEKTSDGCAVDFQTDTGKAVKNLINTEVVDKCRRLRLDTTSPSKKIAFFHQQGNMNFSCVHSTLLIDL